MTDDTIILKGDHVALLDLRRQRNMWEWNRGGMHPPTIDLLIGNEVVRVTSVRLKDGDTEVTVLRGSDGT